MDSPPRKQHLLGTIGVIIGILALAAAFLSPWIAIQIDPPARPIEEVAVDFAARLAEAAKAKLKGEQYKAPAASTANPSRFLAPVVIGAGMFAALLGVIGGLRSENKLASGGAVALGVSAAVVQWSILIVSGLMLLLLIGAILIGAIFVIIQGGG